MSMPMRRTLLATCIAALGAVAHAAPDATTEARVDAMLGKLSIEQKVDLIGGVDNFYVRALPTVGMPRLSMSDGPVGVRGGGPSTAYAAGVALAATWDPALAQQVGQAMGRDARARGFNFILGPGVNMYRAPLNGRNMEYFGEDPWLAGKIAVGMIEGIQGEGVVATVKHFAANNSEYDRRHLNTLVDERTLREIYLPAFEMAVKEAHVGAVMGSYNLINGDYLTENRAISHDILKDDWGFDGIFMSDWEATHDGVKAFKAGLDLEMPAATAMTSATLLPLLHSGALAQADLDDKVRRILRVATRFGFLDRPQKDLSLPLYSTRNDAVALDAAREALVLLKNEKNTLPFDASVRTIAVIGPDAHPAIATAGGSSHVEAFAPVSILTGLTQEAGGKLKILYSRGIPSADDVFKQARFVTADGKPGLVREDFANADFQGAPESSAVEAQVNQWKAELWTPAATARRSIRWRGRFVPEHDGDFLFLTAAASLDTYVLYVDGKAVIAPPQREGQSPVSTTLALKRGKAVDIRLEYRPDAAYSRMGLGVIAVDEMIAADAREIAAHADAAVVAVGFDGASESEGYDRSFALPWGQEALIEAVAAVQKRTVVTVTSGGGYATDAWLAKVPALLQNWYPGQEGGRAIAEVLLGERSPEGKLPMSFEKAWADNPTHDHYDAPAHAPGTPPTVKYGEGVFLGYRWYTSQPHKPQPLFPFGFGLSYSSFRFANLMVKPAITTGSGQVAVSFDVTNTGGREAAEVAQVYVGEPAAHATRPARELKAFRKVRLAPGQTGHVELTLDRRAFAWYDVAGHDWKVDAGRFEIHVGNASNDTPLSTAITIGN
jgi:beta-glucosidase